MTDVCFFGIHIAGSCTSSIFFPITALSAFGITFLPCCRGITTTILLTTDLSGRDSHLVIESS